MDRRHSRDHASVAPIAEGILLAILFAALLWGSSWPI